MKTWLAFFVALVSSGVPEPSHAVFHVYLFRDSWYGGPHFELTFGSLRRCYNIDKCFNDAASSAIWSAIPEDDGPFRGATYIEFFTDVNCQGLSKSWMIGDYDFPKDFALDGLDNQISSFVIKSSYWDEYYNVQCGRRRRRTLQQEEVGRNGSLSDGNSSSSIVADCSEDEDGVFYLNETSSDAHNNTVLVDETHASDLDSDGFFRNATASAHSRDLH